MVDEYIGRLFFPVIVGVLLVGLGGCTDARWDDRAETSVRVMTYNIEDVRTRDLRRTDHPRLTKAAARIQALAPEILLVNEITYDQPGAPGFREQEQPGQNARRFVENYLVSPQADTMDGRSYQTVMLPVNTGQPSGYDLNNDGRVVTDVPHVSRSSPDGHVPEQTSEGRAYGNDAWGFGTFPGQYGMAVFVHENLDVLRDSIRTFREFRWSSMPEPKIPVDSTTGDPWYNDEEWAAFRLSSKNHWDVPVRLPDGSVLHVLASHPTPPAFDGAAQRNARRNHDEIQFWVDYIDGADYMVDDSSRRGGLHDGASFVVLGDLNADPNEEGDFRGAIRRLVHHSEVHDGPAPTAGPEKQQMYPDLEPHHTARWGKRVDYVLPSSDLTVDTSGVWRPPVRDSSTVSVSDHFPVWIDVQPNP